MIRTQGQVAYEAFAAHRRAATILPTLRWSDLTPDVQAGWEVAAAAVLGLVQ